MLPGCTGRRVYRLYTLPISKSCTISTRSRWISLVPQILPFFYDRTMTVYKPKNRALICCKKFWHLKVRVFVQCFGMEGLCRWVITHTCHMAYVSFDLRALDSTFVLRFDFHWLTVMRVKMGSTGTGTFPIFSLDFDFLKGANRNQEKIEK